LTFQLAGQDTTARAIEWTLYFLALHPSIAQKIREEVAPFLEATGFFEESIELSQLPYTHAVWNESLRLRGPAPYILLTANEDLELEGTPISKGTSIGLLTRKAALDEKYFTDHQAFQPERYFICKQNLILIPRWLNENHSNFTHSAQGFLPFGYGPRICRNLANLEGILTIATLCYYFYITKDSQEVTEAFAFTLNPANLILSLTEI
jgi:cytochrome P450